MRIKNNKFIMIGLICGLLYGVWPIIYAYTKFPSMPGLYELGLQVLIVVFFGFIGAALGFLVGVIMELLKRKSKV